MWGERQWLKLGMTEVGMMVCLSVITISFWHGLSFEIINAFLTGLFCLRYHCLASKAGKGVWLEQPFLYRGIPISIQTRLALAEGVAVGVDDDVPWVAMVALQGSGKK